MELKRQKLTKRIILLYLFASLASVSSIPKTNAEEVDVFCQEKMLSHLKEDKITEGLCEGIKLTGEILKKHFPHRTNDVDELADMLSFGK